MAAGLGPGPAASLLVLLLWVRGIGAEEPGTDSACQVAKLVCQVNAPRLHGSFARRMGCCPRYCCSCVRGREGGERWGQKVADGERVGAGWWQKVAEGERGLQLLPLSPTLTSNALTVKNSWIHPFYFPLSPPTLL